MKILAGTLFLLFMWVSTGLTKEPDIPRIDEMIDWIPEEVPRTVSFYIDTDADGEFDLIIAYSLIEAFPCKKNCVNKITDNGDHWILPAPGINYFVIKKWIMYRHVGDKKGTWRGIRKTSAFVYKYKTHDEWYENEFLLLHPNGGTQPR